MLNLHSNNNDKKNIYIKKSKMKRNSCDSSDSNPGYMGSKSTKIFTTLRYPLRYGGQCNLQIKIINIC